MAKVNLWQLEAREKAIKFLTMPPGDSTGRTLWIPRSQIEHISRNPPDAQGVRLCHVTVTDWLAEKENL